MVLAVFASYVLFLSIHVITAFEGRRWDLPAHVYAAPLELYAGAPVTSEELVASLRQTGYEQVPAIATPGEFAVDGVGVALWTRSFQHWDGLEPSQAMVVSFDGDRVTAVRDATNAVLPLVRLEPVRLGSLFA